MVNAVIPECVGIISEAVFFGILAGGLVGVLVGLSMRGK